MTFSETQYKQRANDTTGPQLLTVAIMHNTLILNEDLIYKWVRPAHTIVLPLTWLCANRRLAGGTDSCPSE
jgi:hypothetical protein